ncbi:probable helicase senataxin isoform X2 [Clarias gariepinus]|uniref:probable helicase senataxin isoform X2 n=1 Tax=Clarias gariepinus TaxID=13013 RepID=UPI00234DCEEA|nr:probable helicase senataxin isoform X2 [Clarias gariepinus]
METCLWCTASAENDVAVTTLLKQYCSNELNVQKTEAANSDLQYCLECVVEYHRARERVPALHKSLWKLETARLLQVFQAALEVDLEDDDLFFVEDGHEQPVPKVSPEEFHNQLRFPLMEVLKYPYLLCHLELCDIVVKVLCKMEDMNNPLPVHDQYQGTYLLMVHPDETVRRWAIATARSLGRVDRDNYYDLQEVFSCMFYIIDLGITVDFPNVDESYCSGKLQMLPPHLYDSKNKKNYWLGICMLLMQLDSQAMDSLLMGPEGQASIPQCIINTMSDCNKDDDPGSDPFWPALHCFLVILDRLGSRIWGQIEPLDAFHAITRAGSYEDEIKNIRKNTSGARVKVEPENDDDLISCSQIVYACYTEERTSRTSDLSSNNDTSGNAIFEEMSCLVNFLQSEMGQSMRVYGSTFLWFIPFVRAVMEVPVLNSICIGEVIHYLKDNVSNDVLSGLTQTCDKVTELFIRMLVDIIELHLSKGCMEAVNYFAPVWVNMVMQCAVLSDDYCNTRIQDPRRGIYAAASRFGRGTRVPAVGLSAISQACIKLIRSLLREGGRTGTIPEAAHYLDVVNRHLRDVSSRKFSLSRSEYDGLNKCLRNLVKAISDRPAVSNDVLPRAPPTPPTDPPENVVSYPNSTLTSPLQQLQVKDAAVGPGGGAGTSNIKDEPLWHQKKSFCDREIIKVKEESHNAIEISEVTPFDFNRIKPDYEKIEEIRSIFNDQNLSKIHAIAKRSEAQEEQGQCSGLKEIGHVSDERTQPSTSQFKILDSAVVSESSKHMLKDDDDEPLNIRRKRLKRSLNSGEKDSTAAKHILKQSSSGAKHVHESNTITGSILDDELFEKKITHDPPSDEKINKSLGREYDDLSESQLFEFETQEHVVSAWNEPQIDSPVVTKNQKLGNDHKACRSHDAVEPMATQPVSEEDIERASLQVEVQTRKRPQPLELHQASSTQVPTKPHPNEKRDLIQSKNSGIPTEKFSLANKKAKQCLSRKPPGNEAPREKKKMHHRTQNAVSRDPVKPGSSSPMLTSPSVPSTSTTAPHRGISTSSVACSSSAPAIVPPKKVRKRVESEVPPELIGLKKKARKAFDLSQRSLDCLGELRSHGQNVHVELQLKSKSNCRQKIVKKGIGLDPQAMQYIRQSRGKLQKSTPATDVPKSNKRSVPEALPKSKPAVETVEEPSDEEDYNYPFLPCSQPDPERRTDNKIGTSKVNTNLSNDSKIVESDCAKDTKSKEHSSVRNNQNVGNSIAEHAESSGVNCDEDDDEWTYLTQNEPTDMELCSQMELMEEEYGENLMITSCDSCNQSNISGGESSVPLNPLSSNMPQKSLSDASLKTSSDDNLFLKPSLPTECQKKAKPSTTKIYSSSSRSASLVKELEKVAAPPPLANVARPKVTRPPPAMAPPPQPPKTTPQHEFRQPLPKRPAPHSSNQTPKSPLSNVTPSFHVPSYKTYPRPEAPVSVQTSTVTQGQRADNSQMYEPSYLKHDILKWEYSMFNNYEMFGTPQELCTIPLKEVPTEFSNYKDYFNIFYPLLLNNTFEEMVNEWLKKRKFKLQLQVQGIEYSNRIASASFTASLNAEQEMNQLYPKEDDLVLLWLPENTGAYVNDEPESHEMNAHFGCVSRSSVISNGGGQASALNLIIQTRGNVSSVNTQSINCEVIGSLISTLREFRALCLLPKRKMLYPILKPDIRFFGPSQDDLPNLDMPEYNADQTKAIRCGVAMVRRKQNTPKILLIHGPPGTGKSKIIVGMLQRFFSDGAGPSVNRYSKTRRMRILICAPSNAAIDSLMKKIIAAFKAMCLDSQSPQGTCGDINLVRLGSERTISKDLTGFSLDRQVRKALERAQQKNDSEIHRRKEELDKIIDGLSRQCAKTEKKSPLFEQLSNQKISCLKEREKLSRQLKEFRSKRQEVQSRLLLDAHVICCTLSTSGSGLLESAFRRLGHEPFNCVIVDEAGQAKETETLIPLLYQCPNLILVGDPHQLTPTVVSQKAKELGFDQSLMARAWKRLYSPDTRLRPFIFLGTQYRMHPYICEFPSKYIYGNELKNDRETAQKLCSSSWLFEPYRVFDVVDGKESKDRDSFSNMKEVKLVVLLFRLLWQTHAKLKKKEQIRVGIITPYNAQKLQIKQALEKETDNKDVKKYIHVEVDTVDGFQGREIDCTIVSCVRASNENGSIGFVGNRQRMNVTITRAKSSLFILGHLRTLKEQRDWGALIEDAKNRGTIITAHESIFHEVTQKVVKPNRLCRSYSHPPSHTSDSTYFDRQRDHRTHTRPIDPRLPECPHASREQDNGHQNFTHTRPPNHGAPDPRLYQNTSRLERRRDRHVSFSLEPSRERRK